MCIRDRFELDRLSFICLSVYLFGVCLTITNQSMFVTLRTRVYTYTIKNPMLFQIDPLTITGGAWKKKIFWENQWKDAKVYVLFNIVLQQRLNIQYVFNFIYNIINFIPIIYIRFIVNFRFIAMRNTNKFT